MSYAPSYTDLWRRAADLCGQDPERRQACRFAGATADEFELVINLKAAKQIGLTIPPNV